MGLSEGKERVIPVKVSIMEGEFIEKQITISCHGAKIYVTVPVQVETEKVDIAGEVLSKHTKEQLFGVKGSVFVEVPFTVISQGIYPPLPDDITTTKAMTVVIEPGTGDIVINSEDDADTIRLSDIIDSTISAEKAVARLSLTEDL